MTVGKEDLKTGFRVFYGASALIVDNAIFL